MKTKENKINKFSISYYLKKHKIFVALYLIYNIIPIISNFFITIGLADAITYVSSQQYTDAIVSFMIVLCIQLGQYLLDILYNYFHMSYYVGIANEMRIDVSEQAFKISSKSYSDHNTANFSKRIINDPERILNRMAGFINMVGGLISSAVILIYVAIKSPVIAIIFVVALAIVSTLNIFRKRLYVKNSRVQYAEDEKASSLITEVVKSERDVKSLNLEQPLKNQLIRRHNLYKAACVKTFRDNSVIDGLINIISTIAGFACLLYGVATLQKGAITLAVFMIVYGNYRALSSLASTITFFTVNIADIKMCVYRINELYENKEYELETFGSTHIDDIKGKVEFKNVAFSYTEYSADTTSKLRPVSADKSSYMNKREITGENVVFTNLSFCVQPNSTVAFVGKSGSGKSTILNLIAKLYEVNGGEVLIDDVNVNDLDKPTLRQSISLVNQFPYIFDMTIKENLLMAKPDATEQELEEAIKASALDKFISTLPAGMQTVVGESGIKLSGGQRQRLAIARALLKQSSIILFDESTSSLDNLAQNVVKESIDNIKGKSTIVIVAHRLSTIRNVDKIFFLENGQIVDSGTFEELFNRNKQFEAMFLAENID